MADLIVRDHAAQAIEAYLCSQCDRNGNRECIACPHLDGDEILKSVQSVNHWIQCSERMPENRCGVIFTVDRGHPFVCVGYRINTEREGLKLQRWFDKLSGLNFSDYDVKAWMPMPDAYEPPEKE